MVKHQRRVHTQGGGLLSDAVDSESDEPESHPREADNAWSVLGNAMCMGDFGQPINGYPVGPPVYNTQQPITRSAHGVYDRLLPDQREAHHAHALQRTASVSTQHPFYVIDRDNQAVARIKTSAGHNYQVSRQQPDHLCNDVPYSEGAMTPLVHGTASPSSPTPANRIPTPEDYYTHTGAPTYYPMQNLHQKLTPVVAHQPASQLPSQSRPQPPPHVQHQPQPKHKPPRLYSNYYQLPAHSFPPTQYEYRPPVLQQAPEPFYQFPLEVLPNGSIPTLSSAQLDWWHQYKNDFFTDM